MKSCSNKNCPVENPQPLDRFSNGSRNKDGKSSQCKTCKYASNKRWENANKDRIAIYERSPERIARHKETTYAWRAKNQEKYNTYMRQRNKEAYPWARFKRYGITKEWFDNTLELQDNKCAICKKANPSKKRCLAVDHIHATKKVRGILCYKCNRDMNVIDDASHLEKCLAYKKKYE